VASFSLYLPRIYHFSNGIIVKKLKSEISHQPLTKEEYEELQKLRKRISDKFPSVPELAKIAAILTNGQAVNYSQPTTIAKQAIELWRACEGMRRAIIEQEAQMGFFAQREISELIKQGKKQITPIEIPNPKKYPVDFDEFLRLTVGGRHKAHRLKIYRDYAKDMVWLGHVFNHQYKNKTAVINSWTPANRKKRKKSFDRRKKQGK
jgi:hypothetical protein